MGDPQLDEFDFDQGNLYANVNIDRLDSLFFPRNGYFATLGYTISREWLGSDTEFDQVDFDCVGAKSFGKHTVQLGARYHVTTSGTLPVQSRYRLGGRGRLAGFRLNELTGQHYALVVSSATATSWRRYSAVRRSWAARSNTATPGKAARTWRSTMASSMPASISDSIRGSGRCSSAYGWRETGDGVLFLEIGRPF